MIGSGGRRSGSNDVGVSSAHATANTTVRLKNAARRDLSIVFLINPLSHQVDPGAHQRARAEARPRSILYVYHPASDITRMVGANSASTCRQAPHGPTGPSPSVTIATAT